jgi:hypothetical protein
MIDMNVIQAFTTIETSSLLITTEKRYEFREVCSVLPVLEIFQPFIRIKRDRVTPLKGMIDQIPS